MTSDRVQPTRPARGLRVMGVLTEHAYPLPLPEIASKCGLDTSTTHRLLQMLVKEGYVLRDDVLKRYLISPKGLFPLALYHPWNIIRRAAMPSLIGLRDDLGHTSGLVLFYVGERITVDLAQGQDEMSPVYGPWLDSPLHASGSGKVLLMDLTHKEREEILGPPPWQRYTPHTIVEPGPLHEDLDRSREAGYVIALDDYLIGSCVIAAPIRDMRGSAIGCFFVNGRSSRFPPKEIESVGAALTGYANLFSQTSPALRGLEHVLFTPRPSRG
ncbi:MAG: IclR family transcriptional regulator [Hyphomicrobiales bacterium]